MMKVIYASQTGAKLDSNVYTGGGTDDTAVLQAALDEAKDCGGVHLIMNGAALITGLRVYSNTTIECLSRDCGFFQKEQSNCAIISNYDWDFYERTTRNVILKGGTYNQDCLHQAHQVPIDSITEKISNLEEGDHWIFGLEFYGVEFLEIRDLTVRNFRTFAVTIGGFKNVTIENVWLDLPNHMDGQNQDGFHFWGPGEFLTIRNVGGRVGDDFMNLGPDEQDKKSSITDVLIDGVFLEDADQAIRMLSREKGRLDRVTIRNVSGTYRSFGFYICNWFESSTYGDYGNIFIENIDLRQTEPNYTYRSPILFNIGGNVESIILKNIRHHLPQDGRTLFELGRPFAAIDYKYPEDHLPNMENIIIDGLTIIENGDAAAGADYIEVFMPVEHLAIKNVTVLRKNISAPAGHLIAFKERGCAERLVLNDVITNGFEKLIDGEENAKNLVSINVINSK